MALWESMWSLLLCCTGLAVHMRWVSPRPRGTDVPEPTKLELKEAGMLPLWAAMGIPMASWLPILEGPWPP